ncbi:MAG: hypothetical protein E3J72_07315 [Planctomycetota bacterium]|nr:MAG: hypothetical protein E3J72_07315 [Planctomycetota bacterium]
MKLRIALNSAVIAALVTCTWLASGCNSTPKPQDRVREIKKAVKAYKREKKNLEGDSEEPLKLKKWKLSVRIYKDVLEWLKHNANAKDLEIIDPSITVLKMALDLNSQYSEARFVYGWCLKEKGKFHDNRANWHESMANGKVFHAPTLSWRDAKQPPTKEQVAEYRYLEKQEREKARPILRQALQQITSAAQIAKAATPDMLKTQGEIYLLLGKPLEAYEIFIRLSRDTHLAPSEQQKCKKWAEAIKNDPGYKKALQEHNRRRSSPR